MIARVGSPSDISYAGNQPLLAPTSNRFLDSFSLPPTSSSTILHGFLSFLVPPGKYDTSIDTSNDGRSWVDFCGRYWEEVEIRLEVSRTEPSFVFSFGFQSAPDRWLPRSRVNPISTSFDRPRTRVLVRFSHWKGRLKVCLLIW